MQFDMGCVNYHVNFSDTIKVRGPGLTVCYAMGVTKHLELLASASMTRGTDHNWQNGSLVLRQYNTESVELGLRGHVDFSKKCYAQLSAQAGFMMFHCTDCYEHDYFYTSYRSVLSFNGNAGVGVRVTPVVAILAYFKMHGHVGVLIRDNPHYDFSYNELGLSLNFRLED